jgi:hypothetical protein
VRSDPHERYLLSPSLFRVCLICVFLLLVVVPARRVWGRAVALLARALSCEKVGGREMKLSTATHAVELWAAGVCCTGQNANTPRARPAFEKDGGVTFYLGDLRRWIILQFDLLLLRAISACRPLLLPPSLAGHRYSCLSILLRHPPLFLYTHREGGETRHFLALMFLCLFSVFSFSIFLYERVVCVCECVRIKMVFLKGSSVSSVMVETKDTLTDSATHSLTHTHVSFFPSRHSSPL